MILLLGIPVGLVVFGFLVYWIVKLSVPGLAVVFETKAVKQTFYTGVVIFPFLIIISLYLYFLRRYFRFPKVPARIVAMTVVLAGIGGCLYWMVKSIVTFYRQDGTTDYPVNITFIVAVNLFIMLIAAIAGAFAEPEKKTKA